MSTHEPALLRRGAEREYVLGGKATFTIENTRTGGRFTYRVKLAPEQGNGAAGTRLWFVSVLTGPQNTTDYSYIGTIAGHGFYHGKKSRITSDAPSVVAFAWFWQHINRLPEALKVWHSGTCSRCGRELTTPESVETGIGPVCAGRAA
jgi:hypothetical protein